MSGVLDTRWFRDPLKRRLTFAATALILAVLCVWPRHYIAKAELLPQEPGGGLSSMLSGVSGGGLLNIGALLGQHQSIETQLAVARSHVVVHDVILRLHLIGRRGFRDTSQAEVKLRKKVNIEAVRGSILQVKVRDADPAFARELAAGFADEIHDRLATLNLEQTAEKRAVAENRMSDATIRLARAQAAVERFRESNKLAVPEAQLGSAVYQLASLQGWLQAKQVQLDTLLKFATSENVQVKLVRGEIASLQAKIARAQSPAGSAGAITLAGMAAKDSEYYDLYRDEKFSQVLYEIYTRYLEATTIDELSAENNISMVEPSYVDPARQFNVWAEALFFVVVLLALSSEFYIVRPPVGRLPQGRSYGENA